MENGSIPLCFEQTAADFGPVSSFKDMIPCLSQHMNGVATEEIDESSRQMGTSTSECRHLERTRTHRKSIDNSTKTIPRFEDHMRTGAVSGVSESERGRQMVLTSNDSSYSKPERADIGSVPQTLSPVEVKLLHHNKGVGSNSAPVMEESDLKESTAGLGISHVKATFRNTDVLRNAAITCKSPCPATGESDAESRCMEGRTLETSSSHSECLESSGAGDVADSGQSSVSSDVNECRDGDVTSRDQDVDGGNENEASVEMEESEDESGTESYLSDASPALDVEEEAADDLEVTSEATADTVKADAYLASLKRLSSLLPPESNLIEVPEILLDQTQFNSLQGLDATGQSNGVIPIEVLAKVTDGNSSEARFMRDFEQMLACGALPPGVLPPQVLPEEGCDPNESNASNTSLVDPNLNYSGVAEPYQCTACFQSFETLRNLTRHARKHKDECPFVCTICLQCFTDSRPFIKHMQFHNGQDTLICTSCGKSFNKSSHFISHVKTHSGQKPFSCAICSKAFSRSSHLTSHMRVHTGEKPFSCAICNKAFSKSSHLTSHMRAHTGEKPYACKICSKAFSTTSNLSGHMKIHSGEKPFLCDVCNKSFSKSSHLIGHMRTHTGERPFSCMICCQTFSQASSLTSHMRTHTGEKSFICSICGKFFSESSHLTTHMRTHTGEKPYSCETCGQSFAKSSSLTGHVKTHTGEKPYPCPICLKTFSRSSHVTTHMRVHTGEKPYTCTVCNRTFSKSSNLNSHMKIHTGEKIFACTICFKAFARSAHLTKHMRVHNKK